MADEIKPEDIEYARRIARRMTRRCPWLADDAEGAALYGLVLAAKKYDPAKANGGDRRTYYAHVIRGEVLDHLRFEVPKGFRRRSDPPPAVGGLGGIDAADHRAERVGWEIESEDEVIGMTRTLPARTRAAVRAYYLRADAATAEGVARTAGGSVRMAKHLIHEGQSRLREDRLGVAVRPERRRKRAA